MLNISYKLETQKLSIIQNHWRHQIIRNGTHDNGLVIAPATKNRKKKLSDGRSF